ncbi:MAG: hypothetical protein ACRC10_02410 [Thermoguttaceae bacterium]
MFFRKKKNKSEQPVLTPVEKAKRIGETAGLLPAEIAQLLGTLAEIESDRVVIRQKVGEKRIGKPNRQTLEKAKDYAKDRAEKRQEEEEKRRLAGRKKGKKYHQQESNELIATSEWTSMLYPSDMSRLVEAAKTKMTVELAQQKRESAEERRGKIILEVLDRTKETETARLARTIAKRQERIGQLTEEELAAQEKELVQIKLDSATVEEQLEAARSLQRFGKNLHTLTDEAAGVVEQNLDAAANIMRQWVGNVNDNEGGDRG